MNGGVAIPGAPEPTGEVTITDLNHDGEGVGRMDGLAVFVPGAVPGDVVRIAIVSRRPRYARGRRLSLVRPSPDRAAPPCPLFGTCGGCQLQHWSYAAQLAWKERVVAEAFRRIGRLDVAVRPTIGQAAPFGYRNKSQFPVGCGAAGEVVLGFYRRGSHTLVPIERCAIQDPRLDEALAAVQKALARHAIVPYDEAQASGFLRHVVLRASRWQDAVMLIFITAQSEWAGQEELVEDLVATVPRLASIFQNVNPNPGNVIFGPKSHRLWGAEHLVEAIGGLRFLISPRSFFQVNLAQAEVLYETALRYVAAGPHATALDLYCGTGTLALFLARAARIVHGVEEIPEAVADARENARLNGIANARFHVGRAEQVVPALLGALGGAGEGPTPARARMSKSKSRGGPKKPLRPDLVMVDPPRAGCKPEVLAAIGRAAPAAIVYVSCNPSTLARDAAALVRRGYRVIEAQPVDMFPQTAHVECVAWLKRAQGGV